MEYKIQARNENGNFFAPYSEHLVTIFKNRGGRWNAEKKCWKFSPDAAEEIFAGIFGTGDIVTVDVCSEVVNYGNGLFIGNYLLAYRPGRDYSAKLAEGVDLIAGRFASSAGSRANPRVGESDDATFRLCVKRSIAEKYDLTIVSQPESIPDETTHENPLEKINDETLINELKKRGYAIEKGE